MKGKLKDLWEWLIDHEQDVRRAIKPFSKRHTLDELWSDVVLERAPRIFELWDTVNDLTPYMITNLRWYAFKHVEREQRNKKRHSEVDIESIKESLYYEIRDSQTFAGLIDLVCASDDVNAKEIAYVLQLHYVAGYSIDEIGAKLGLARSTTYNRLHAGHAILEPFLTNE